MVAQTQKPWRLALTFLLIGLALLAGCGKPRPVLHLFTWEDYLDPAIIAAFEREHGCRVVIDTFAANAAMFAKLSAGGSGYDLVLPTGYFAELLEQQNLLQPIDPAQLPNLHYLDQALIKRIALDPDMAYSVPYTITLIGLAARADRVDTADPSWFMLGDPALRQRTTVFDGYRAALGTALLALGHDVNTLDESALDEAVALFIRWRANAAMMDNSAFMHGLASGEFWLTQGFDGDTLRVTLEDPQVVFLLPREGVIIGTDNWVIPRQARRPDLAHAFINYLCRPEVAAQNMAYTLFLMPNRKGIDQLPAALKEHPGITALLDGGKDFAVIRDLGENNALYLRAWEKIKR